MMKPGMFLKTILTFCATGLSSACSLQTLPMETIYSSNNCAISNQLLKSINSASELDQLLKSFPGRSFSSTATIDKAVDYRKQSLILFALGQKSSAGHSIQLHKNVATLKGKTLYLPINIQQPAKNSFQAQMLTSPCRIFSIPKTKFTKIHIGDI